MASPPRSLKIFFSKAAAQNDKKMDFQHFQGVVCQETNSWDSPGGQDLETPALENAGNSFSRRVEQILEKKTFCLVFFGPRLG